MGSIRDDGNQYIGWKYYTPLKADYINTFMGQVITPGLVTRPRIALLDAATNLPKFQIHPFTAYIEPSDAEMLTDENGNRWSSRLVKITTTQASDVKGMTRETVAIGMSYSLVDTQQGGSANRSWYASFEGLTASELADYQGLIIATVQHVERPLYDHRDPNNQHDPIDFYFNVTTQGADISNVLLEKEGWNPRCWLSVISPRRAYADPTNPANALNKFELRCYNDPYTGTIAGKNGLKIFAANDCQLSTLKVGNDIYEQDHIIDPFGARGFMRDDITFVYLNSMGFGTVGARTIANATGTPSYIRVNDNELTGANPTRKGWYEFSGGNYTLSADTSVVSGKTYYTISGLPGGIIGYIDSTKNNLYKANIEANELKSSDFETQPVNDKLTVFTNNVIIKPVTNEYGTVSAYDTYKDSNGLTKGRIYIK